MPCLYLYPIHMTYLGVFTALLCIIRRGIVCVIVFQVVSCKEEECFRVGAGTLHDTAFHRLLCEPFVVVGGPLVRVVALV